jgi:hypothetical protein
MWVACLSLKKPISLTSICSSFGQIRSPGSDGFEARDENALASRPWSWSLEPRDQGCPYGVLYYRVRDRPLHPGGLLMNGPTKNRLHDYEAGWLTLLLKMGVASEKALQEAQNRVAQQAIDEMNEQRERRRAEGNRRRRNEPE